MTVNIVFTPYWDDEPSTWDYLQIEDKRFVGTVEAEPARKLEDKSGAGSDGVRYTDKGFDAKDIKLKLKLWTRQHLEDWDSLIPKIKPDYKRRAASSPITISHPSLDQLGINRVIVQSVTNIRPDAKRLYTVDITCKVYKPPKKRNVTRATIVFTELEAVTVNGGTAFTQDQQPSNTNTNP